MDKSLPRKRHKVVLVSHSQKLGGAERCLLEAAIGLKKQCYDVYVTVPSNGDLNTELTKRGIKTIVTTYPWWVHFSTEKYSFLKKVMSFFRTMRYARKFYFILKSEEPDLVLSNTLCVSVAAFASFFLRKKHVWYIHEYGKEDHQLLFDFGTRLSAKIISLTSARIIVNSQAIKLKYSAYINSDKIDIVNYDIPTPEVNIPPNRLSKRKLDLLIVGQIHRNKGQMDALEALNIIIKRGYDGRLIIVGQVTDVEYFQIISKYISEHRLLERVKIINHNSRPYDVVENFTIGLMCSEYEALGRVTIEYMKLGIPVVGANTSTTAYLIENGYNGLLYEVRNSLDLSEKIIALFISDNLTTYVTQNAKTFAESKFNTETFISGLKKQFGLT